MWFYVTYHSNQNSSHVHNLLILRDFAKQNIANVLLAAEAGISGNIKWACWSCWFVNSSSGSGNVEQREKKNMIEDDFVRMSWSTNTPWIKQNSTFSTIKGWNRHFFSLINVEIAFLPKASNWLDMKDVNFDEIFNLLKILKIATLKQRALNITFNFRWQSNLDRKIQFQKSFAGSHLKPNQRQIVRQHYGN